MDQKVKDRLTKKILDINKKETIVSLLKANRARLLSYIQENIEKWLVDAAFNLHKVIVYSAEADAEELISHLENLFKEELAET